MAVAYHAIDQQSRLKDGVVVERELEDGDKKKKCSRWQSWNVTVTAGAATAIVVLIVNVSFLAYAALHFEVEEGIATIYQGI